jgi:hypothetical protein
MSPTIFLRLRLWPSHVLVTKLMVWIDYQINWMLIAPITLWFLVRKRTIPIERSPPVSEASANFSGQRVLHGQRYESLRP